MFDDDLFDAQLIVERHGAARYDKFALADLLGVAVSSVWVMIRRGELPAPADKEWVKINVERSLWTVEQVVGIVLARRAKAREQAAERMAS